MTWWPLRCYTSIIWSSAFVQASSTLSMGRARTWPTEATRHRNAFLPFSHGFSFIESFKELCALCRNALSAEQEHFGNGSTEGHCVSLVGIILDCYRLPVFLLNWVSAVKSINCDSDSIAWDLELVSIICIAPFFFVCGPNVAEAGADREDGEDTSRVEDEKKYCLVEWIANHRERCFFKFTSTIVVWLWH